MNAQAPDTRHSRQPRSWGLIAVLAGFLVSAASMIAIGLVSLDLVPALQ